MNTVVSLQELENSGLVAPLGVVEQDFERDLAAALEQVMSGNMSGNVEVSGYRFRTVDLDREQTLHPTRVVRGGVIAGSFNIEYCDVNAADEKFVRLSKTLKPGSTFMFPANHPVILSAQPGTRLVIQGSDNADADSATLTVEKHLPKTDPKVLRSLADEALLDLLDTLDFSNVSTLQGMAPPILAEIGARRDLLRRLLREAAENPELRNKCECLPDMYKFVLDIGSAQKARLRLHIFRTDYEDVPHSHRWPMTSYVIRGTVMNKYYGSDHNVLENYNRRLPPVVMCHRMTQGGVYSFDHTVIHWFHGAPGSVTLTIRGPLDKDVSTEFGADALNYKFGAEAKREPNYVMTAKEFDYGLKLLRTLNLV